MQKKSVTISRREGYAEYKHIYLSSMQHCHYLAVLHSHIVFISRYRFLRAKKAGIYKLPLIYYNYSVLSIFSAYF